MQEDLNNQPLAGEEQLRRGEDVARHGRRHHQNDHLGARRAQAQLPHLLPQPRARIRVLRDPRLRRHARQEAQTVCARGAYYTFMGILMWLWFWVWGR